ncbi:hypothetical protein NEOLEDRAFT_483246 [Neolentinus lepideus HHB14362 ss-1]|uniref:Uncharacterized protein n=1 Tax=Neolentinus lepideus HHB14362 ss-1 TaxID=1314782 RepID=A0A165VLV7_9AGAM|nr:hypothetical protein NEOLEDRAFT_483246 [Neolentinus lepideus HHB14362 ss-1]
MSIVGDVKSTPTHQTPSYITSDGVGPSFRRQVTLKSRLTRLPILEAPRRQVTLQDCTQYPGGRFQTPEVHPPTSIFAVTPSPEASLSSATSPSSSLATTSLPPSKRRRSSMSQSGSSTLTTMTTDSYFHLPVGNHTPRVAAVHMGVRLEATKDAALQPPSPLALPPSSSVTTYASTAVVANRR